MTTDRTLAPELVDPAARLDRLLAGVWPDLSRSRIQALIRAGHVSVGTGIVTDPSSRPRAGMPIALREPDAAEASPRAQPIPLAVVHEDDALIVIDKPAGLVVHPGAGHEDGTLVNALLDHCGQSLSGIGGVRRPGIVHRLDKNTSGLLVVAKTDRAHQALSAQFADHGRTGPLERAYLAFVWTAPEPRRGIVDAPLIRSTSHREKITVATGDRGRHALTRYEVAEVFGDSAGPTASLIRCTLETGRTHQIRVHMAHLGHPLIGDDLYGSGFRTKASRLPDVAAGCVGTLGRQALHATLLQFQHPDTGALQRFESPLPADLAHLLTLLRA